MLQLQIEWTTLEFSVGHANRNKCEIDIHATVSHLRGMPLTLPFATPAFLSISLSLYISPSFPLSPSSLALARNRKNVQCMHWPNAFESFARTQNREMNFSIVINRMHPQKSSWESCILIATFIHSAIINSTNNKAPSIDSRINQIH